MSKQATVALLIALSATGVQVYGQAGAGKKYDARDPFVCKSTKEPAAGAPSPNQVKDYVKCNKISGESIAGGYIWLLENGQFEIGKSRPFSSWSDVGSKTIDNSQPVYPIRGTVDNYQCGVPGAIGFPAGGNCHVRKAAPFVGTCFKTTFGDWSCQGKQTGDPLLGVQVNMPSPK